LNDDVVQKVPDMHSFLVQCTARLHQSEQKYSNVIDLELSAGTEVDKTKSNLAGGRRRQSSNRNGMTATARKKVRHSLH
jgi:hypothetical protein